MERNMNSFFAPTNDPALLNLKNVAQSGREERGPLYDQGVLAVIGQIEREGCYVPDRRAGIICLMKVQEGSAQRLLTADELETGRGILAQRGWTLDQAVEYFNGIRFAEQMLHHLRKPEEPN
jgi:hypothetical protein